jgi:hypothetical protein
MSFIHNVFEAGGIVEVNPGTEAAPTKGGQGDFLPSLRLRGPAEFDAQGSDHEFIERNAAIQCRSASPFQKGFIKRDGGTHDIMMFCQSRHDVKPLRG